MKAKPIGKLLEVLARDILAAASRPETALEDKLEAFKLVTAYHLGVIKALKKADDDEPEGGSFDKVRRELRTVGGRDAS
jgi:hypothetical protein